MVAFFQISVGIFVEDEPILTSVFFKWVGQTTTLKITTPQKLNSEAKPLKNDDAWKPFSGLLLGQVGLLFRGKLAVNFRKCSSSACTA